MFLFMILWSLLFAGKQALSNVKNFFFTNVSGNVSADFFFFLGGRG